MPIPLGVLAVAGAGAAGAAGAYELLETQILTSNQNSVIFSNLNSTYGSTYKHLQVRMAARGTRNDTNTLIQVIMNGIETNGNYAFHFLQGTGSAVTSNASANINSIDLYGIPSATATANNFGAVVLDILDAFSTNKNKTVRALSGFTGTSETINLTSGVFLSTSAITSLTFEDRFAQVATGTRISIYGLRSA